MNKTIQTARLLLRPWTRDDFIAFRVLNSDPRVMEHFPATLSAIESDALATRLANGIEEKGWGLWAVSVPNLADFIGFIGLSVPTFEAHFTPNVEVGWRLAYDYWGQGFATEGAKAALQYGFEQLMLPEIVSFTAKSNIRSIAVMQKIGLHSTEQDDFDHPKLPEGHRLRRHVLYRLLAQEYRDQQKRE